jgi:hypothetical protein
MKSSEELSHSPDITPGNVGASGNGVDALPVRNMSNNLEARVGVRIQTDKYLKLKCIAEKRGFKKVSHLIRRLIEEELGKWK